MAQNGNTFDAASPARPAISDFNGAQKINDPNAPPPNVNTDPNAPEYNELCADIVAIGQVTPLARVSVAAGASPSITKVIAPGTGVNGNLGAFILTRNGVGNYTLETLSNTTLPPFTSDPAPNLVGLLGAHNYGIAAQYITGPNGHPAAQVTTTIDGVLADFNFAVTFY